MRDQRAVTVGVGGQRVPGRVDRHVDERAGLEARRVEVEPTRTTPVGHRPIRCTSSGGMESTTRQAEDEVAPPHTQNPTESSPVSPTILGKTTTCSRYGSHPQDVT